MTIVFDDYVSFELDFGPGISLSCSHDSNLVAYSDQRGHTFVLDISERKVCSNEILI